MKVKPIPTVRLSNGLDMPIIGLGTWMGAESAFSDHLVRQGVEAAIDIGYRHIDTAWMYRTEKAIGQAIANKISEAVVERKDLFVTSKLWMTHHAPEDTREYFKDSLKDLKLDYIDLYLMHQPFALKKVEGPYNPLTYSGEVQIDPESDIMTTWKVLEDLVEEGLIKSIGVSNFNSKQVQYIIDNCEISPVVNQCEVHMNLQNSELLEYCKKVGVVVTGYSPLGNPPSAITPEDWNCPLTNPIVLDISQRLEKTPAQVVLKFQLQRGLSVVPKTLHMDRMKENVGVFDFELTEEDMDKFKQLDQGKRLFTWAQGINHKDYPFNEES